MFYETNYLIWNAFHYFNLIQLQKYVLKMLKGFQMHME